MVILHNSRCSQSHGIVYANVLALEKKSGIDASERHNTIIIIIASVLILRRTQSHF